MEDSAKGQKSRCLGLPPFYGEVLAWHTGQERTERPIPSFDAYTYEVMGSMLRAHFAALTKGPIPDHLFALLDEFDRREKYGKADER